MNRRKALLAAVASSLGGMPLFASAQPKGRMWRIGTVHGLSWELARLNEDAFIEGMKGYGYAVGRNFIIDARSAQGDPARYAALVDEIITLKPDVLIGANTAVALIMKSRTATIPIVLATSGDPVGDGLVNSLARPGGNVTGVSLQLGELGAKHFELMLELQPRVKRVAVFINPSASRVQTETYERLVKDAAAPRKVLVHTYRIDNENDVLDAFRRMEAQRPDALLVFLSPRLNNFRRQIIAHAERLRLASIAHPPDFAQDGGLMSYGPRFVEGYRLAAYFVDRILKGAKPADLPLQQPTKFTLVLNVRTAKAIGIAVSGSIRQRADHVIE